MDSLEIELILARHLVSRLAVPVLLVDARGDTLFFNEPAEQIFRQRFDDFETMSFEQRAAVLAPLDREGEYLPPDQLPGMVAMRERRPAHAAFRIHSVDRVPHDVEATAIPLEGVGGNVLGAMVILWKEHRAAARE